MTEARHIVNKVKSREAQAKNRMNILENSYWNIYLQRIEVRR